MPKNFPGLSDGDSAIVRRCALDLLKRSRANFAAWESDCEDYARQGYRPHYCRHGRNMWTDNDIPCGTCEDSGYYYFNYLQELESALGQARSLMAETVKRRAAVLPLIIDFPRDPAPLSSDLWAWVSAPIIEWSK